MKISLPDMHTALSESLDSTLVSKMRMILALSMLLVTFIDPSEPRQYLLLTNAVLGFYSFYSIVLFLVSLQKPVPSLLDYTHWIDLLWCLILIALSSGTSSVFFFLYFFAIQIAAFRFGLSEGVRITIASVLSFIVLGMFSAAGAEFELNRFLLRPVYLGVLGYMISYWGGNELQLKRRLELIKDINNLYNPRFGTDLTISSILQKILASFGADSCLLISWDAGSGTYNLRQCDRWNPEQAISAEPVKPDHPLLELPGTDAVIYSARRHWSGFKKNKYYLAYDWASGKRREEPLRSGEILADLLNVNSFISVPFYQREVSAGRLFLTSEKKNFDLSDMDFLKQILRQAVPVIENVNLLDRLASEATEQQRQKISRDIHDSTVQPYIGIKLGLEALQLKQASGADIATEINQLIEIANTNIAGIRTYITKLKGDATDPMKGVVLVSAIRQQAKKIGEFYGIDIEVEADDEIYINDRFSAEVFQIVSEGLSNIKRHTKADRAAIRMASDGRSLRIEIQNNKPDGAVIGEFVPKSMSGRAKSLGGHVSVTDDQNSTAVLIDIPL